MHAFTLAGTGREAAGYDLDAEDKDVRVTRAFGLLVLRRRGCGGGDGGTTQDKGQQGGEHSESGHDDSMDRPTAEGCGGELGT